MTEVDRLLDEAFSAYNNKDFDYAQDLARSALTLAPTNGDGLYLLGLIATKLNAFEPAEKLLYQAVQLYPDNKQYKLSLGFALEKQGRLDEALSFYEPFKEDAFVLSQIGFIYLQKGLDDFAKSAFDKALLLNQTVLTASIGLALLARRAQQFEQAFQILETALSNGQSAELYYQLALTCRLLKRNKQALSYIQKALNLEETASFYNEEGLINEALGFDQSALLSYENAILQNSFCADAYANMGNLYYKENNLRKAEDSYKRALGIDSQFLDAHHNLALVLYKQERLSESLEHFRSAIIINPKHYSSLYNLAIILEETGEYSEAAGLYFNLLVSNQSFKDLRFRIFNTLSLLASLGKKEKKQALTFAEGWIKNYPDDFVGLYSLKSLKGEKVDEEMAKRFSEELYDSFADSYDEVMQKLCAKSVEAIVTSIDKKSYEQVLDLACGTGAFGEKFDKEYTSLTGVDISANMIEKAREKEVYTRLVHQDIFSFLTKDTSSYDLIIAADVIPYLPELSNLFKLVFAKLSLNGQFLFTVETDDKLKEGTLGLHGRYLYPSLLIRSLIKEAGLIILDEKELPLRKEGVSFADGKLFVCSKEKSG